jgi:hypothetical protein
MHGDNFPDLDAAMPPVFRNLWRMASIVVGRMERHSMTAVIMRVCRSLSGIKERQILVPRQRGGSKRKLP